MTLTACPYCGTQTGAGFACLSCGTPVPSDAAAAASSAPSTPSGAASGHAAYWQSMQPRVQQLLAPRYRITGLIGYGGMAGVFAAEEPRLGRSVAIKVMSPALMMDPQLVERFVQEARTIALLDHSNIVDIYEVEQREDLHWFVMSYLSGRTLGQVMTEAPEPLPVDVVRAWVYQIGDALAYAHRHGIVHRDVKPGNVLLDQRGNAHVTDFGIAKVTDGEAGLTRTGMLVGTPAYMSPEQCAGAEVDGASDQYSLGAVVYQMLTGSPPFEGATLSILQAHVAEPPRGIEALRPDCPPDLAAAVHRMLAKQPGDRWPTMGAAIAATGATPLGLDDPLRAHLELVAAHAASLEITPACETVLEGSVQPLRVVARDVSGRLLEERRVRWTSSTAAVAALDGNLLQAYSPGTTRIEAVCGGARAHLDITVLADPVQDITLVPTVLAVARGGTANLGATVFDIDGTRLHDRVVLWSTSDPSIARVTTSGEVHGVSSGQAVIVARTGSRFATAEVTVTTEQVARPPAQTRGTGSSLARTTAPPRVTPAALPAQPVPAAAVAPSRVNRMRRAAFLTAGIAFLVLAAAVLAPRFGAPSSDVTTGTGQQPAEPVVEPPLDPVAGPVAGPVDPPPVTERDESGTAQPREPEVPRNAELRLGIDLPAGGSAIARARNGRTYRLGRASISLPPGSYALELSAPGYESESHSVDLKAGDAQYWSPVLRQIVAQAPPPAPEPTPQPRVEQPTPAPPPVPVRDLAADRAAVQAEVAKFVDAMNRRDAAAVLPLMAGTMRTQWQTLFGNTTAFSATLAGAQPVQLQDDGATVRFTVNVAFRNPNGAGTATPTFTATAQRAGNTWRITAVSN
jgi:hypothetical protein